MNILYGFEHQLLPKWTYTVPEFYNDLINNGEQKTLYRAAENIYDKQGEKLPFTEADFSGFHTRLDVDTVAILLRFPQPPESPLCYCALIFLDAATNRLAYYTLEKGMDPISGREMQFLCGWDKDMKHREYTSVYADDSRFGDELLIRYFYSVFRDLRGIRLPLQPKEENENTTVLQCPACKEEIIFDFSEINEGDGLLLFCKNCGRIYQLSYENNDYMIKNKIK